MPTGRPRTRPHVLGEVKVKIQDFLEISTSTDSATLERRLIGFSERLGFGRISAVAVCADHEGMTRFSGIGNPPDAYVEAYSALDRGQRCPVMQSLRTSLRPVTYDQSTYVRAGAADLWEEQAPFGYRYGVAVALHLSGGRHFAVGVDRDEPLPADDERCVRLMGDVLLLASWAVEVAIATLTNESLGEDQPPSLTPRELEVLKWTLGGKSSWVVGKILRLGEGTVNYHLRNAMRKLDTSSKHVAATRAMQMGLIDP